jgi:predicted nucleic acid-binding protein
VILVDSSIWISHFRSADARLADLLEHHQVVTHPFVIGELACGVLPGHRAPVLAALAELPESPMAQHGEVLELVERRQLAGSGIGWLDAHLIAAALLGKVLLWTHDRPLARAARRLGLTPAWSS